MLLNLTLLLRYSWVLPICPTPVDCWLLFESGICGTTEFHWAVAIIGLLDETVGRQQLHSCSPMFSLEFLPWACNQGYASCATSSLEFPWIPPPMKMDLCFHTLYCYSTEMGLCQCIIYCRASTPTLHYQHHKGREPVQPHHPALHPLQWWDIPQTMKAKELTWLTCSHKG